MIGGKVFCKIDFWFWDVDWWLLDMVEDGVDM